MSSRNDRSFAVLAARPNQTFAPPKVDGLSEKVTQDLKYGHKVSVFVDNSDGKGPVSISTTKVSLSALLAMSPVVKTAMQRHNRVKNNARIDTVVLAKGDLQAYRELIIWVKACIKVGSLVPVRHFDKTVASELQLRYLAVGLRQRIARILAGEPGHAFSLDPADIIHAFVSLREEHWLRYSFARTIAAPATNSTLHQNFRAKLQELYIEVPALGQMVANAITH